MKIPALRVHQWLQAWEEIEFDPNSRRSKPKKEFLLFSMPAGQLRRLCGINRRAASGLTPRSEDIGIQRTHDEERSDEISRFVSYGYPWSQLSEAKRKKEEFRDLQKPGWLPTSIVVNILGKQDIRHDQHVSADDMVNVDWGQGKMAQIEIPEGSNHPGWTPQTLSPIEVIDGQHRLLAFGPEQVSEDFEVPVVAFSELDISWQAYLFWTINIKPKRINPSLAFDLYPLLRSEEWLERAEGHAVYRETRAQELTEALWSHPASPWYEKINMLGEKKNKYVSQSAWIRNLVATLVKRWEGPGVRIGGLFGERIGEQGEVLAWNRVQQAAFLIRMWSQIKASVYHTNEGWAKALRDEAISTQRLLISDEDDAAFYSPHSLIMTDQGVRGILHIVNDIFYAGADEYALSTWHGGRTGEATDVEAVNDAMHSLETHPIAKLQDEIARNIVKFDWRTSRGPNLDERDREIKAGFRGSGGYKQIRRQLLRMLSKDQGDTGVYAGSVFTKIEA